MDPGYTGSSAQRGGGDTEVRTALTSSADMPLPHPGIIGSSAQRGAVVVTRAEWSEGAARGMIASLQPTLTALAYCDKGFNFNIVRSKLR